ncbi:hypothetical protein PLICRDRAFT_138848 [Plicaturopsis crispa FD-325 SS-3]|nr:hypothetical protein PLICRDRAFT_138848 [Plicaturopsis crispa FD-325 SS-3]
MSASTSATTRVTLSPTPGFCVKSTALVDCIYSDAPNSNLSASTSASALAGQPVQTRIPKGFKVFVNVAWDKNVPAPPQVPEDVVQRAMRGEDVEEDWYVPVVVSKGRQDVDRAGKPSLVFDCVMNAGLKARTLREPEFKDYLIDLALQQTSARSSIPLARPWSTPNIRSKGKVEGWVVSLPKSNPNAALSERKGKGKPLIEEIKPGSEPTTKPVKGILKPTASPLPTSNGKATIVTDDGEPLVPRWTWEQTGEALVLIIEVPGMTRAQIPQAILELAPRQIYLDVPVASGGTAYHLDLDLDRSDAELVALDKGDVIGGEKRARALHVDTARAEWRVAEGVVVVYA